MTELNQEWRWWESWCLVKECGNNADVLMDGTPVCFDHLEDFIERENAVFINPKMREFLPSLMFR